MTGGAEVIAVASGNTGVEELYQAGARTVFSDLTDTDTDTVVRAVTARRQP